MTQMCGHILCCHHFDPGSCPKNSFVPKLVGRKEIWRALEYLRGNFTKLNFVIVWHQLWSSGFQNFSHVLLLFIFIVLQETTLLFRNTQDGLWNAWNRFKRAYLGGGLAVGFLEGCDKPHHGSQTKAKGQAGKATLGSRNALHWGSTSQAVRKAAPP